MLKEVILMFSDGVVGYIRVSSLGQLENGAGLDIQKDKIKEYCKDKGLQFTRFYEDKAISGAVRDRPALLELLKDCELGLVKKVIVYRQDRLSRELTVALWIETQFKKHGIDLISVTDLEYNLDDPLQKAFKRIADVFAELEKEVIVARLRDGRFNKAKRGKKASGSIAYGYQKEDGNLIIKEDEAQWIRRMFRWKVKGFSYSKIVNLLKDRGARTRKGNLFSIEAVRYITKNEFYFGKASYGEIQTKGEHEAIISKRLFMRAERKAVGLNTL